jgi:hypothetical protein
MQNYVFWVGESLAVLGAVLLTAYPIVKRRGAEKFLCADCRFNSPELCQKNVRPLAVDCTAYRSNTGTGSDGYAG